MSYHFDMSLVRVSGRVATSESTTAVGAIDSHVVPPHVPAEPYGD